MNEAAPLPPHVQIVEHNGRRYAIMPIPDENTPSPEQQAFRYLAELAERDLMQKMQGPYMGQPKPRKPTPQRQE